jgi:hypothetical protein
MNLPHSLSEVLAPLFEELPLDAAMCELTPQHPYRGEAYGLVSDLVADDPIAAHPELVAGLWLYVDDLHRSHEVSQGIYTPVGSVWHGIMHRREGDYWNSKYWFQKAGPAAPISAKDAAKFVDQVEAVRGNATPELIAYQRQEWQTLFEWCAMEAMQ